MAGELKVAVLGAGGTIAPAIVRDLAESDEVSGMVLLDIDDARAAEVAERHGGGKAKAKRANARAAPSDHDSVTRAIGRCDVLVNSASYRVNLDTMRACLDSGTHYIDLGGLYWMTARQRALSQEFEQADLIAVLGIGSSPGKTNLMAARAARELGEVDSIHVAASGRDMEPPPGLSVPYALQTLIDELTLKPVVVRADKPCEIEPLSDGGLVDFGPPIGEVPTIYTLHSELSTFGESFGARNVSFRLALEPGLLEKLRKLVTCSADRIAREQRKTRPQSAKTVSVHLVEAAGGGSEVRVRAVAKPSKKWRLGGGIVSTAAPAAAAVRLLARGEIRARGALPPERCLDPESMFAELEQRGTEFEVDVTEGVVAGVIVGVPTEVKADEYRVALTPAGARELREHGHEVLLEAGAGDGSSIPDAEYEDQGARIMPDAASVWAEAELVLGVKEPLPEEVEHLRSGQVLFTYLHLAPAPELTKGLCESGAICIAYETVEDSAGRLPLLAPMSEIAGKIATQAGAYMLEKPFGGRGILLGGVPGVAAANVLVIGGGAVGLNAAFIAIGMEADVFVFDRSIDRLRELDMAFGGRASTVYSSVLSIEQMLPLADMVIGAVLVHGAKSPHVIRREQLSQMKRGAVLVDVSIDQGGCFETSRPTTHREPTFEVDGVTHYCVTNMPGAVPITATFALTNATLPYVVAIADRGVAGAIEADPGLRLGINVANGTVTHPAVAEGVGVEWAPPEEALRSGQRAEGKGQTGTDSQEHAATH